MICNTVQVDEEDKSADVNVSSKNAMIKLI